MRNGWEERAIRAIPIGVSCSCICTRRGVALLSLKIGVMNDSDACELDIKQRDYLLVCMSRKEVFPDRKI